MTATIDGAPGIGLPEAGAAEVTALRAHAAAVVRAELLRLRGKLPAVDGALRAELEVTVLRVVDHLLTTPEQRVRVPGRTDLSEALRELFALA